MSLTKVSKRPCEGMTYPTNVSFALFAQSAQQQPECPPAGASQEVNEVVPSLAAPSASGQQAGTPAVKRARREHGWWDLFDGPVYLATRRAVSGKAACAAFRRQFALRTDVELPRVLRFARAAAGSQVQP